MAFAFLYCVEGIPLVYYGDEIGLAGAGDPDNRRPMPFEGWSAHQQATYDTLGLLASIRREHRALSRGTTTVISGGETSLVVARTLGDDGAFCVFNRAGSTEDVSFTLPAASSGATALTDALGSHPVSVVGGTATVTLPPRSAAILVP
jgi:glycosidase